MAEKEYIDRNDLINNRPPQRNPNQTGKEEYNKGYNDGVHAFLSCINEQPIDYDVYRVIHCSQCKRWHKQICEYHGLKTEYYDYCSYGERKDG